MTQKGERHKPYVSLAGTRKELEIRALAAVNPARMPPSPGDSDLRPHARIVPPASGMREPEKNRPGTG